MSVEQKIDGSAEQVAPLDQQAIIEILINDLSDELDHPELWPAFGQFLDHFPDLAVPVAARLNQRHESKVQNALTVILALCFGAMGRPEAGLREIYTRSAICRSPLLDGARRHLELLLAQSEFSEDYELTWSPAVADVFRREKISVPLGGGHLGRGPEVLFEDGARITIPGRWRPERFSWMPVGGLLNFGAFTYTMSTDLWMSIEAGRYCSIALGVRVMGPQHPTNWVSSHFFAYQQFMNEFAISEFGCEVPVLPYEGHGGAVRVGHDVWIGQDVMIKQGVTIGTGAIVAAGSIVTKDVPEYAIVGGTPARTIRMRFDDATIERMLGARWWRFNYVDFADLNAREPASFLDGLEAKIAAGTIQPFDPGRVRMADILRAELG